MAQRRKKASSRPDSTRSRNSTDDAHEASTSQQAHTRSRSRIIVIAISVVVLLVAILLALISGAHFRSSNVDEKRIYPYTQDGVTVFSNKTGAYGVVKVVETEALRLLIAGKSIIGGKFIDELSEDQAIFTGFAVMEAAAYAYVPDSPFDSGPRKALVLGLGVGGLVHKLSSRYTVDSVELDQLVIDAARTHFGLNPQRTVFHADALQFAASPEQYFPEGSVPRYSLIVHDLFTSGTNSLECLSRRSLANVKNHLLEEHGILLVNFVSFYRDSGRSRLSKAIIKTIRSLFANVHCYVDHEPDEHEENTCNILCFCSDSGRVRFKLPGSVYAHGAENKYSVDWVQEHFQKWEVFPDTELETWTVDVLDRTNIDNFGSIQKLIHRESTGFVREMVPAWVWE